jgi:hypothetical protein
VDLRGVLPTFRESHSDGLTARTSDGIRTHILRGRNSRLCPLSYGGKFCCGGRQRSRTLGMLKPGTVFKTVSPPRRCLPFVVAWSRMQDSNPRGLFTRQVLSPVELIRRCETRCAERGSNPRPPRYKRVAHTIRAPGALSVGARGGIRTHSLRFRKPVLSPLSHAGVVDV